MRYLKKRETSADGHTQYRTQDSPAESYYRGRWAHDKVVRSTHGVNCTGSCSWKVYVKDGIITWETQETDYPSVGPDRPEYEPRGCPRGAAFSWYTYSPTRVRYPYVRSTLLEAYREQRAKGLSPVQAWTAIQNVPATREGYQRLRGMGGFARAHWDEVNEIIAAAHVHTIDRYGPDRIAGFSPIPAMSIVSHGIGARFMSLIGGTMLSFYDWYADLPVASPQVFGDQTDVPESGDWWDATCLMLWGSNVPVTRTPDAHWMAEARYRGQDVTVVSPDYSDATKFADHWLAPHAGTDGAMAMAMGHVVLKEYFVDRTVPYFDEYTRTFTDAPYLVALEEQEDGSWHADKFLTAADLGEEVENAEWKLVVWNRLSNTPAVPEGSIGHRWSESDRGGWNLRMEGVTPALTLEEGRPVQVDLPRFDRTGERLQRGVRTLRTGNRVVTTVFELMLAQYGVQRPGLPGKWPSSYRDSTEPYTPAWQEAVTGVRDDLVVNAARRFADSAEGSNGRAMMIMGCGLNHWFNADTSYRAVMALPMLCGAIGRNGGGWAHYVGQEKCRPAAGWSVLAAALDWARPPRQTPSTPYWYLHTEQWRYDRHTDANMLNPLEPAPDRHTKDLVAEAVRYGWMPMAPAFNENPLKLGESADPVADTVDRLRKGDLKFAAEDPSHPDNWPRVLTLWRSNLLGSSGKGDEYFLHHLLGTNSNLRDSLRAEGRAPTGKLDLLVTLDFRMTSSTLMSDIVLPAATWYEKHDLSTTDMHPFIHAFNPAIDPPWQSRTDYRIFLGIAERFSELAEEYLGKRKDLVAVPIGHDTPGELSQPGGRVPGADEWTPGRTMPGLVVVERDYPATYQRLTSVGPMVEKAGIPVKGVSFTPDKEVEWLKLRNGTVEGRPSLETERDACEMVLAFSGTTNGRLSKQGFERLGERVGTDMSHIGHAEQRIVFSDTQDRPTTVGPSPEWSGIEAADRRYTAFSINVEHRKPWHTLTGRMHFFLDHDWMRRYGEQLPLYRPPLDATVMFGEPAFGTHGESITLRYLTPHNKWAIHSEYQDNLLMLSLSRGGPSMWMNVEDAASVGIGDNDWIEAHNRNGVVAARAVVTHRMPRGLVYFAHATERTVDTPKTETTGKRGGIHNSMTRILVKPTHMIGGYGQFTYAFNYMGPTGNQRDEVTTIRRRASAPVY
ncbi:nitrate reductase subunit alpha [Salininema proteolyticum]|uniref:nitrate reductase (quinone) n=1 Tax=Salininema proteolyticum TaxID=1607685 RepID=A0ABV8U2H2_9ACTN